jgi:signal transduction histidine kinase
VTVSVEGAELALSAEADHSAYRILQESLTNVLLHAGPGTAVQVCLRYQPEALTITVTDDGRAARGGNGSPARSGTADHGAPDHRALDYGALDYGAPGHGIRGMRERAALVGGQLTAGPLPGGGFQVRATLPITTRSGGSASRVAGVPVARSESS